MENWGLITFRETSLLVQNQSSPLDKQLIANVVAHELAHQVCRRLRGDGTRVYARQQS